MLGPGRQQVARARSTPTVRTKEFPPPTKGWISKDNIAVGGMGTALILDNIFPFPDVVEVRAGFAEAFDTAETTDVETVMAYHPVSGAVTVFSVTNGKIFAGASVSTVTGLSNSRMESVMFATSGGNFLFCVNGADTAKHYSGSTWATPSITGTTSDNFSNLFVFKERLFFIVKDTMKFAYLPVNSIAGAANRVDLGSYMDKGGYLVAGGTLTKDGGAGQDDLAIFVSSEGQIAVFQGNDPDSATTWSLVGVFTRPRPLGKRCLYRTGGDLYLITEAGVLPVSKTIGIDEAAVGGYVITQNISNEMSRSAKLYRSNFGWQIVSHSDGPMTILNVPISDGSAQQYVMNSQTGAWCRFTNINAKCWAVVGGNLYFGGSDGKVYQFGENGSDNGETIIAEMKLAFDGFGTESRLKRWLNIRSVIYSDGSVTPALGLDVDFSDNIPSGAVSLNNSGVPTWGGTTWGGSTWATSKSYYRAWRNLTENPGYAAAIRMRAFVKGTGEPVLLQVNGFNVSYEIGGVF
jgi:hypothetical protein